MKKDIFIPIVLFFLSVILTVMLNPVALLVVGVVICVVAMLKYRASMVAKSTQGSNTLLRTGLAVIAGAIVAFVFVFAAMSGLFGR
jgi:heme/copper-type cytochrome/quinol oxidase subunit 2